MSPVLKPSEVFIGKRRICGTTEKSACLDDHNFDANTILLENDEN